MKIRDNIRSFKQQAVEESIKEKRFIVDNIEIFEKPEINSENLDQRFSKIYDLTKPKAVAKST